MARKPADQSVNREDIIIAAADVLRRSGYEATTMKDIAAEVNLTAASLYHHFKNKDTLLLAVLEGGLEHVTQLVAPIVHSDRTAAEKLAEMVRLHVTSVAKNTAVGAAMVFEIRSLLAAKSTPRSHVQREDTDFAARREAFFALRDEFEEFFRCVIREGIAAGEFRPVDVPIFVKTMLGAQNWVPIWYRPEGRLSGDSIAAMMAEAFLAALKA